MDLAALKQAALQFLQGQFSDSLNSPLRQPAQAYLQGLAQRLNDPGTAIQQSLEQQLAPFVKAVYRRRLGLDAVTGSDETTASLERAEFDAAMGMVGPTSVGKIVYHGSPHKFDKFDMSKVGSGEGSQAYGHGLYFADSESVANSYKAMANNPARRQGGLTKAGKDQSVLDSLIRLNANRYTDGDVNKLAELIQKRPGAFNNPEKMIARIAEYENNLAPSYLYKVDIPEEAANSMLHLDEDLPEELRKRLSQAALNKFGSGISLGTGEAALKQIESEFRLAGIANPKIAAVEWLREQGVPGLKFFDAGSRNSANGGTLNYVLFDDVSPRILEVNGAPTGMQPWLPGEWQGLK